MNSPIDIIRAANRKEPIRIELELPGGIKCWMHLPNKHQISDVREKLYRIAYAEACELGLAGKPINQAEFDQLKSLPNYEKMDAPRDLAEQYASAQSLTQIIYNLLPGLIRDDAGEEIFPALAEKREFLAIVRNDLALEAMLIAKWTDIFQTQQEVAEHAKNS